MKTKKNNKVTATSNSEAANSAFERSALNARCNHWGIKPRNKSLGDAPAAMELATLAATLARDAGDDPQKLCSSALNLWFAAREAISLQNKCNQGYQSADDQIAEYLQKNPRPELPKNQELPMTLETCCQIFWPSLDTGDRAAIIRAWLKSLPTNHPNPMMNGISYEKMKSEPIGQARFYFLRDSILPWYAKWKLTANSEQKSKNAQKSWQDCDAKTKRTPEYQAYEAECEKLGRKTNKRGFKKWLVKRTEPDEPEMKLLKKIMPHS